MSMTNEQREALDKFKHLLNLKYTPFNVGRSVLINKADIYTVLSLIKEQQEREELIKEYVHQEIVSYTETIIDYIDDDKEGNKDYIGQLKEEREHWKDIEKILQNKPKEELYMNWWRYGLYE